MKTLALTLALAVALISPSKAFAADELLGSVATGATLVLPKLSRISVQCAASAYVVIGRVGGSYTSADGIKVSADALLDTNSTNTAYKAWVFQDSGATTCKFFEVK